MIVIDYKTLANQHHERAETLSKCLDAIRAICEDECGSVQYRGLAQSILDEIAAIGHRVPGDAVNPEKVHERLDRSAIRIPARRRSRHDQD